MTVPQEPETQEPENPEAPPEEPTQSTEPQPQETPPELSQTELSYSDHVLYAQSLYDQPSWVVEGAFGPGGLDPNVKHTPADVTTKLSEMMLQPDKQFDTAQEVQ